MWFAAIRVLMCVKHEIPLTVVRRASIPVWVESVGCVYVSDRSELLLIGEIYRRPCVYERAGLPEHPRVVVDLGANVGLAAKFFHGRYPDAEIVAFEPDPQSFRVGQRNIAGATHVSLRNLAVAGAPGPLRLHRVAGSSWRTSAYVTNQTVTETFEVNAVTLDSIIEELGTIDVLKMDIEGAEYEVLRACRHLDRVDCIVGELHRATGVGPARFFDLLSGFDVLENNVSHRRGMFLARRRRMGEPC
jgi:FkbM family methyltransferase